MNLALEAVSAISWWTTFKATKSLFPEDDVLSTALCGSLAGLTVVGITIKSPNVGIFPETSKERTPFAINKLGTVARFAAGHAVFFTVYTGLQSTIKRAKTKAGKQDREYHDIINDGFCGGISGLCYRAAAYAYSRGSPIASSAITNPRLLLGTFIATGLATSIFELVDYNLKQSFRNSSLNEDSIANKQ